MWHDARDDAWNDAWYGYEPNDDANVPHAEPDDGGWWYVTFRYEPADAHGHGLGKPTAADDDGHGGATAAHALVAAEDGKSPL